MLNITRNKKREEKILRKTTSILHIQINAQTL